MNYNYIVASVYAFLGTWIGIKFYFEGFTTQTILIVILIVNVVSDNLKLGNLKAKVKE